jgi:pimeloyl-ACP methyl ester carboxylesterase
VPKSRALGLSCAALAALAVGPASAGAQTNVPGGPVKLSVTGFDNVVVCNATRPVARVAKGATVTGRVAGAKTRKARSVRKGSTIALDRCEAGRWVRVSTTKLGARRTAKRVTVPTAASADLRLRIVNRRKKGGAASYVRVARGELVDTPISFTVRNQNRSQIPCLNAPDGGTYTIRGTLVAPRSRLDSAEGRPVTLYYHGLSYTSSFFRFKAVPGYDYGMQQAENGHASVIVDRLGYGRSDGPEDANRLCYASQADIGDQLIDKLRAGDYTTDQGVRATFGRVGMVGHSAGAFITEMTQYLFRSADAIGVLGYNDTAPSPLVLGTLTSAASRCVTAPSRKDGGSGPRNYAYFGETPQDYVAGHIYNAEPKVVEEALKQRVRDPCGDLISVPSSFAVNQAGIRSIEVPTLVLSGDRDAFFPPSGNTAQSMFAYPVQAGVGNGVPVILPDTGHALTLGRTHNEVVGVLDAFLSRWGL